MSLPPEAWSPALFRDPVPSGVVFGFSNKLNLARLSGMQVPAEAVDSVHRIAVVGAAAVCPSSVYAVGHVL